jgi:hypothetical protein
MYEERTFLDNCWAWDYQIGEKKKDLAPLVIFYIRDQSTKEIVFIQFIYFDASLQGDNHNNRLYKTLLNDIQDYIMISIEN